MNMIFKLLLLVFIFVLAGCAKESNPVSGNEVVSGSYSRMLIYENWLYYISDTEIMTVDISNPANPVEAARSEVGFNIESLYRYGHTLFIGSPNEMYLYIIDDTGVPVYRSGVEYSNLSTMTECDPIVVKDNFAYVTLSSGEGAGAGCGLTRTINALLVFDISDPDSITEVNRMNMRTPKGLGADGNYLFVCEANFGVEVIDISDPATRLEVIASLEGFKAYDLIVDRGLLMVIGDELELFDYSDIDNIKRLSSVNITP